MKNPNAQLGFIPELMPLNMGPPLPKSMGIYWPWYRPPEVPVVEAPPAVVYPPVTYPPVAPPVVAYPPVAPPVAPPVVVYPPVAVPEAPPPAALYVCPTCGAQFADLSDLYAHIGEVHPEAPPEIPIEIFTCPTCGLQFSTFGELQAHIAEAHPPEFSVTALAYPPGGGTVTVSAGGSPYKLGERVILTATPSPGYEFSHWEGIPGLPTDLTYRFPIDRDMIVTGVFKLLEELPPEVPMPPEVPEVPEVPPPPEVPEVPEVPPKASISITAPASAKAGERVVVDVKTTNLMKDHYYLGTELSLNAAPILSTSDFIEGGSSETYSMIFYMPRVGPASLVAVVKYPVEGLWVPIGSASKTVMPQ